MKALVWHGPNRMTVDEVPDPEPNAGEVVVRSEAAGICGSEVEGYLGGWRTACRRWSWATSSPGP